MINALKHKTYGFLRKTEKYAKTDMIYLARGGFWLSIKTALSMLVAFGLSVAFANLLPRDIYGEYKYVFSIFGLLAIPTLLGMGTSVTKSVSQGYEGTPVAAIKMKIQWGMLSSVASAAVAVYYFLHGNIGLAGAFGIVAIFIPFVDTFSLFNAITTGKKLFKVSVVYETIIQLITAVAIAVTLFLTDDLFLILVVYFTSYTVVRLIIFQIVMKKHTTNRKIDSHALTYGKHLSVMEVLGVISGTLDSILLWQFLGAGPLAVYSFARAIPMQINGALKKITVLAFPKFAERDFQSTKGGLTPKLVKMFLLIAIIVIVYIIAAPYIYGAFFPQYTDAIIYSQVFALSLLLFPQKFIATLFQAHARKKALYISSTITPIIRIVLAFILIPSFGIMGAIFTELGARAINMLIISFMFIRMRH